MMISYILPACLLLVTIVPPQLCQHYAPQGSAQYEPRYSQPAAPASLISKQPPSQILSHKQALNHDGNFRYLFTSDNGLAQGESISPDGSRSGAYQYIDPNGKKISVKYTAGKEGFRILEGDHLPRAPQPLHPLPQVPQAQYSDPSRYDDGQYRPEVYEKSPAPQYYAPQAYAQNRQYQQQPVQQYQAPATNQLVKEPEYNDEPGKPHSFGNGYNFEFAG